MVGGPDLEASAAAARAEIQAGFQPEPVSATPEAQRGSSLGNRIGSLFHRNPHTRESTDPLAGVRLDRSTQNILSRSRQEQHTRESASPEPVLTPERRQWHQRLGEMSQGMVVNWFKNLDPRGKDKAWLIGMGFGAGMGAASNFLVAPGVDRLILSAAKFAASQSVYAYTKGLYALEKSRLSRQVTEADLSLRLAEIEKRRSRALKLIGNFMLGLSAGTTYTSITGAGLGAAEHFLGARLPDVGTGIKGVTDKIGGKIQELTGGETPAAPDAPAGAGETVVQTKEALETLTQTKEYQDSIAAAVGNHLDLTDQAVNEAIQNMGIDPAKVSPQAFEHARSLVQNVMEKEANYSFNPNNYPIDFAGGSHTLSQFNENFAKDFNSFISHPDTIMQLKNLALGDLKDSLVAEMVSAQSFGDSVAAAVGAHLDTVTSNTINEVLAAKGLDPSKLSPEGLQKIQEALRHQMENYANYQFEGAAGMAVEKGILEPQVVAAEGNKLFADFLNSQDAHNRLVALASKTLNENMPINQIPGNVQEALSSLSPADLVEKTIPGGSDVGHMLFEAGVQTGWGADQAQLFGAEIAANHELLSAAWAANEHTPFPIEIGGNLQSLIERAQDSDAEALQKLKDALRWIPAGARFKILSKAGVNAVLAAFPKG